MVKQIERETEKYLTERVKTLGGMSIKLHGIVIAGLPDRLILLSNGRLFFAEIKSEGKTPRLLQQVMMRKIQSLGFTVEVIDTKEQIDKILKSYENENE